MSGLFTFVDIDNMILQPVVPDNPWQPTANSTLQCIQSSTSQDYSEQGLAPAASACPSDTSFEESGTEHIARQSPSSDTFSETQSADVVDNSCNSTEGLEGAVSSAKGSVVLQTVIKDLKTPAPLSYLNLYRHSRGQEVSRSYGNSYKKCATLCIGEYLSHRQLALRSRSHVPDFPSITEFLPKDIQYEDIKKHWPNYLWGSLLLQVRSVCSSVAEQK